MSVELKNCPFCDRQPLVSSAGHWHRIECAGGDCGAAVSVMHDRREAAVEAWNRRPAEERMAEVQDELIHTVGRAYLKSVCLRGGVWGEEE